MSDISTDVDIFLYFLLGRLASSTNQEIDTYNYGWDNQQMDWRMRTRLELDILKSVLDKKTMNIKGEPINNDDSMVRLR